MSTIEEVKNYWNNNPVHSVEFKENPYTKEWFENIDSLRLSENERWAAKTFYEFSEYGPNTKLLDAGCGIGFFTRYYARKKFDVTAVDLTSNAVEITKKSLSIFGLTADVSEASIEKLPFAENTFDLVVSNGVIHHTENPPRAVDEIYRVLKPGGKASLCIYYKNPLLREPLWSFVKILLPFAFQRKVGRENALKINTPEELAKVYDGNNTPIAFLYSKEEANKLFSKFKVLNCSPHYFPGRFVKFFPTGGLIHQYLDKTCGFLIYYLLEKPS